MTLVSNSKTPGSSCLHLHHLSQEEEDTTATKWVAGVVVVLLLR
jgi:hypothetical protein